MYLLLADDLTGCCDAGIAFARQGMKTLAAFSPTSLDSGQFENNNHEGLLAINTASRNITTDEAAHALEDIVGRLRRFFSPRLVFKKIDSTMRGHVGFETEAIMSGFGLDAAFITPASPAHGRCVIDGRLLVNGLPLHETAFAKDPLAPVRESEIISFLDAAKRPYTALLTLEAINKGKEELRKEILSLLGQGVKYIIFDATNESQLNLIAEVGLEMPKTPLFVGSAGLASALADALPMECLAFPEKSGEPVRSERIFFVCGSAHKATHEQIAVLEKAGIPLLRLPADFMTTDCKGELAERSLAILEQSSLALAAPTERLAGIDAGRAVSGAIAELAVEVLQRLGGHLPGNLALCMTGGETAYDILSKIGKFMLLRDEPEPGIVISTLSDGNWRGMTIATKAGGFGNPQTLLNVMNFLHGQQAG